ncbi:MAG: 23S rRNA (uracil(1939)-C(5))-methyltransferase RlmD [Proteobacteria bacterium]|nr:MAG: 23S rRNA (uracil(1939)-C(5))-methyltransferase RlmD [Pseudomonadota bacterium]
MSVDISNKPKSNIFRSDRWQTDHSRKKTIVAPAPEMIKVLESCCSCSDVGTPYDSTLQAKYDRAMEKFQESGLMTDTTVIDVKSSPRILGYRAHAKLAVRPGSEARLAGGKRFAIGLFQPNSHTLVHHLECPLHRESINDFLVDFHDEIEDSSITPYSEIHHSGDLRYIAVRAAHLTEEIMVTLVVTEEKHRIELKSMFLRLRQKGHNIVSVHININPEKTNTIFGPLTKKLLGANGLRESLCNLTFEIGPVSFFQINPWQAEAIYRRVEALAGHGTPSDVAWDLYCGTGQISLLLANLGYRTLGIEENPQAIDDALANASRNRCENTPDYIASRVEDLLGSLPTWSEKPDLIVANPSRRGLAPAARAMIKDGLDNKAEARFVYVSCEAETMIRDLKELAESGRRLRQLECYDMFPYTEKLEWIAVFQ